MTTVLTAQNITDWLQRAAQVFTEKRAYLTQLDSDIGDGDHGENLARGFNAVLTKLPGWNGLDPAGLFKNVAMTLISTVGGASGPLYGSFFLEASKAAAGQAELSLADWARVFEAGVRGVQSRGKANVGDKTMLDALTPALASLQEGAASGGDLGSALLRAVNAAEQGAESTKPIAARKGRASYLGERSVGHLDPGAVSSHLLLSTLVDAVEASRPG